MFWSTYTDMGIVNAIDVRTDMCADMCMVNAVDMRTDMCTYMCIDMCSDMRPMFWNRCAEMCTAMRRGSSL